MKDHNETLGDQKAALSRRSFLQGASVAALAAAGMTVVGCSPSGSSGGSAGATTADSSNTQTKGEITWAYSADNPAWALEEIGEPAETITADVCIVGGGATGLSAAIQAIQLGLDPIVLEKNPVAGGSFIGCEGLFAVDSHWQREMGFEYTPNDFIGDCLVYHHFNVELPLLRSYFSKTGETIQWLEDLGVEFDKVVSQAGSRTAWHIPKGSPKPGVYCTEQLIKAAENNNAKIEYETPAKQIVTDEDGNIKGVLAKRKDGTVVKVETSAVILGTGGFADNDDFVTFISGARPGSYMHMGLFGREADGIKMGHALGARLCSEPGTMNLCGPTAIGVSFSTLAFATVIQPYSIWVNQNGDRYARESLINENFSAAGLAAKAVDRTFILFSRNGLDELEFGSGCVMGNGVFAFPGEKMTGLTEELETLSEDSMKVADTIPELAEKCGLDPDELEKTVERYNELCAKGVDEDMIKPSEYMLPFETGPYYAFDCLNSLFFSVGGLRISPNAEVLDENLHIIPGLYAGGSDAGGLYGECYDYNITPGSQGAWAVNSGRIAAEQVADYLKKIK